MSSNLDEILLRYAKIIFFRIYLLQEVEWIQLQKIINSNKIVPSQFLISVLVDEK